MIPIFLSLDKFPISVPGCYGNTEARTPGLDRLAAESMVFDRVYAQDTQTGETLRKMWDSLEPLFASGFFSGERIFLTDDASLNPESFFETVLRADSFPELLETAKTISGGFLWCHARRWNLETLDAALEELNVSALLSVRGAAFSKKAKKASTPEEIRRYLLHHLEIQLPWWIKKVATYPEYAASRCKSLLAAEDLGKILEAENPKNVYREAVFIKNAPRRAVVTEDWFLTWDERLDAEKEFPGELYRKPDDWWEQNNVASRCPEEMEMLHGLENEATK